MISEIIDAIRGPDIDMNTMTNAEYDGEDIEELLPPRSKGGVHMSYSPSREHLREIAEQHGPEAIFGMQYAINRCGTWRFVERVDDETVREQCDSCGEYRTVEQ